MEHRGIEYKDGITYFKDVYSVNDGAMLPPYGDYTPEQICRSSEVVYFDVYHCHTDGLSDVEHKELIDFVLDNRILFTAGIKAIVKYKLSNGGK